MRSDQTGNRPRPDFSNVEGGASTSARGTPSTARTPSSAGPAATDYVVKKGDTLSAIARSHYGNAGEWRRIFEANRDAIRDPDLIHPGQTLRIPAAPEGGPRS